MTSVSRLIADLEGRGILLSLADGAIRYRSPKDALTTADREALRARREEIMTWLAARDAARALRAVRPVGGKPTTSVAQEMWRQFAGGAEEGKPFALNIGMVGTFGNTNAAAATDAVHQVIARYDALRASFRADGSLRLNPPQTFVVEQQDYRFLAPAEAQAQADKDAQAFCGQINFIEGEWLARAKVFALPGDAVLVAISAAHMIADAGTRNIVIEELHDILQHGAPRAAPSVAYNDYSLAEREFLATPQGGQLIDYWRRWYAAQPAMLSPTDRTVMQWGNGRRTVRNFVLPRRVLDKVRALAERMKVTPFLICLTIFTIAMARWSGMARFPVRVLGDKRTALDLSNTVGLMFCADAVEIEAPAEWDFETVMRGVLRDYDTALSLRIPTLHFWAPHCVRPGIEAADFPNKIPAVFNYYSVGTARERTGRKSGADADEAWPPQITRLVQTWPRRSSPLFLHLMDYGDEGAASLHFYADVVSEADQEAFVETFFRIFGEVIPV